jgi:hypothetical protein
MNRRTQGVLLVGGLAVATVVVLGLARGLEHCKFGSLSISCKWANASVTMRASPGETSSRSSTSTAPSSARSHTHAGTYREDAPGYADVMLWAVTTCPEEFAAKGLRCTAAALAASAQDSTDDLQVQLSDATGLPLPERWVLATAKNSPFIKAVYVETPFDLAAVLGFYRAELSKRGWTENDGAVVAPDRAEIAFTTADGPALLRLIRQDDRTIVDLSLRKPAAANAGFLPRPGQVKLMLGNEMDEAAVITINEQTITLAARAGRDLTEAPGRKLVDSPEIDLPPGKYNVTFKVASGTAQNREFEVAAGETWGLLVGPSGVPLPVHIY